MGPLGRGVDRSPYTSFIASDEDSGEEYSRFVVASDDESDGDPEDTSKLTSGGYKRIAVPRAPAGRAGSTKSPYDSDDAPIGILFQRNSALPEYQKLDHQAE